MTDIATEVLFAPVANGAVTICAHSIHPGGGVNHYVSVLQRIVSTTSSSGSLLYSCQSGSESKILGHDQNSAPSTAGSLGGSQSESIEGMPIAITNFSHVRLTVTDIARSRAFYDAIFGLPVAYELPENATESARAELVFLFGGVIYRLGNSLLGLRPVANDTFDEDRVGLDHLSFAVENRSELEGAARLLDEHGVQHAGVKEIGTGYILEFRDPDNIALELFTPKVLP